MDSLKCCFVDGGGRKSNGKPQMGHISKQELEEDRRPHPWYGKSRNSGILIALMLNVIESVVTSLSMNHLTAIKYRSAGKLPQGYGHRRAAD